MQRDDSKLQNDILAIETAANNSLGELDSQNMPGRPGVGDGAVLALPKKDRIT
jgi:hypothetical protein